MDVELQEIISELNELTRDQLDAIVTITHGRLTLDESERYAWRNEQIRLLIEKLESEAA